MRKTVAILISALLLASMAFVVTGSVGQPPPGQSENGLLVSQWTRTFGKIWARDSYGASAGLADFRPDVQNNTCHIEIAVGSDEYYPSRTTEGYSEFFSYDPPGVWHAMNISGNYIWLTDTQSDEARSSVAIADMDSDGDLEIAGGTTTGRTVEVMDSQGNFEWTFPTPPIWAGVPGDWHSSPAVGDIIENVTGVNNETGLEVVILHRRTSTVYAFDGANLNGDEGITFSFALLPYWTGTTMGTEGIDWDLLWVTDLRTYGQPDFMTYEVASPAIADLDNDGFMEVIVASRNSHLFVINGTNGNIRATYRIDPTSASVAVGDVDGDDISEIFIGTINGTFYGFSWNPSPGSLSLMWSFNASGPIWSSAALGDIDGDNQIEVVFGTRGGTVHALNASSGTQDWSSNIGGYIDSSPALANRTSVRRWETPWPFFRANVARTGLYDGPSDHLDVYVGSTNHYLYLLSGSDGSTVDRFNTGSSRAIRTSPVIADINGNHTLDILFSDWSPTGIGDLFWALEDVGSSGTGSMPCLPPVADFTWSPQYPDEGETVYFLDLSFDPDDGGIVSWLWDFAGEATSMLQYPTHAFGKAGSYPVTLNVWDDSGQSDSVVKYVNITNVAPAVNVTAYPKVAPEGATVLFDGDFYDPSWNDTHNATWDFVYNSTDKNGFDVRNGSFAPGPGYGNTTHYMDQVTKVYGDDGEYYGYLNVTDEFGGRGSASTNVSIYNLAPTVTDVNVTLHRNAPRTHGYWKHQCTINQPRNDHPGIRQEWVNAISNQSQVFAGIQTKEDVCSYLDPPNPMTPMKKAKKQLMALWLNVVSGLLFMDSPLDHSDAPDDHTVREFIEHAEWLILNDPTDDNLNWVNDVAADINEDANNYRYVDPIVGQFRASATDPGSDDLTFTWDNGKGDPIFIHLHLNDPTAPEPPYPPYPSPWGTYPFTVVDELIVGYPRQYHRYNVCLISVTDDDGGEASGFSNCVEGPIGGGGRKSESEIGTRAGEGTTSFQFYFEFNVTYREIEGGFIIAEVWIYDFYADPDISWNYEGGFID